MSKSKISTRRSFLRGGALLAAPIAAVSVPAVALADGELKTRVKRLEDEAAIRELHRSWLRQVNTDEGGALLDEAVRRITADHGGASDRIELAADGRSALGYFDCAVEVEIPLAGECTLAQMAHAQGHGTIRRTERRALRVEYTNIGGTWKIASIASKPR